MKKAIVRFVVIVLIICFTSACLASSPYDDLLTALHSVPYLSDVVLLENETDDVNELGLPPHSIRVVVDGGATASVAQAIFSNLPVDVITDGSISTTVTDDFGNLHTVNFSRVDNVYLMITVYIRTLPGYDASTTPDAIKAAVKDTVDKLDIGQSFYVPFLYGPILAQDDLEDPSFIIASIAANTSLVSSSFQLPIGESERARVLLDSICVNARPLY